MLQLHQVQEESEKTYFDSRQQAELAEKSRVEQAELIASLEAESERQAARLVVDGQALATAQVQGKELADELKARDAALEKSQDAMAQAQVELNARDEALRLAHEAQQQLMQDFASLKAESEEQAEQLVAGAEALVKAQAYGRNRANDLKARDSSLKQLEGEMALAQVELGVRAEALMQAQAAQQQLTQQLKAESEALAEAQQLTKKGATQISELEGENELLLLQLHQTQEELEQVFLDKRSQETAAGKKQSELEGRIVTLQAEVKVQSEKFDKATMALADVQSQGKKVANDLKARDLALKQSQEALTKARQLSDKVLVQVSEQKNENELLLLQLHQVQEEMEKYFLENRQLQQVMGQSSGSLDRARRLISRLMLPVRTSEDAS